MAARCPTCKREALPRSENPASPFCSQRCRDVDLGKWLGEEYRVVDPSTDSDEDGQPLVPPVPHHEDEDP